MSDVEAVLALDQGTTNSKAILVGEDSAVLAVGSAPVALATPAPGWVEQDAEEIWQSVVAAIAACLRGRFDATAIAAIAISAQRESVVAWRRSTGAPLGPVIGWQDRRTAPWCAEITTPAAESLVRGRTGLRIDAMFSAPKIRWLLDHVTAEVPRRDVCVGTIDAWLVWRLTGGAEHACDAGNASRTLLYDVVDLRWSEALLDLFGVPREVLPEVRASSAGFGKTAGVPGLPDGIPILAVLADSHAALYGQGCDEPGMAKATYGTGSSVMTPTPAFVPGDSPVPSTLAWLTDRPTYAREGNILSSGATLVWAAELLGLPDVGALVELAVAVDDSDGVSLVPAFSGLGAPYWDRQAQALLTGMSQGSTRAHVAYAAVESIAHQICDVVEEIERDGDPITVFRADGGATASALLMQTQADLLGRTVEVADLPEISALGAARMAWQSLGSTPAGSDTDAVRALFEPRRSRGEAETRRERWRNAITRSRLGNDAGC
ncbi:MAG: FGGY family carbohydrate kinase [Propionibacteriaceae bacterium]